MDAALHQLLLERCRGRCECGCGAKVPPGEIDHFFGRAKAEETEATCWVLSVRCHYEKTRNSPSNAEWQRRFINHCVRLDALWSGERNAVYLQIQEAKRRAEARFDFVTTRGALGSALGMRR